MVKKIERWHEEVLNENGRRAADRLAPHLKTNFYLAGGTALALMRGHRISLDLDLFSSKIKLDEADRNRFLSSFSEQGPLEVIESRNGTLHIRLENTSVSLFHYHYPLLEPIQQEWHRIGVASLKDIAAMKLSAIIGRGARKDFIDLYVLSQELDLKTLLQSGVDKFTQHSGFLMQACQALTYFVDAEKEPPPRMLKSLKWETVKSYFTREVPLIAKKYLRG